MSKKKKIVKLQNKTNEALFELDEIDRDYNKIQSPRRINAAEEAEIYKMIGYKPRPTKQESKIYEREEQLKPLLPTEEDTTKHIVSETITPPDTSNIKKGKIIDSLSGSGVS